MTFEFHQLIALVACYFFGWLIGYTIYKTVKDWLS